MVFNATFNNIPVVSCRSVSETIYIDLLTVWYSLYNFFRFVLKTQIRDFSSFWKLTCCNQSTHLYVNVIAQLSLRCQQYFMAASFIGMGNQSIWRKLYRPTESHFVIHVFNCIEYTYKMYLDVERRWMIWLWIWYLMPISTICQLYVGGQFYWWRKTEDPGKTPTNFIT